jgi:hypothetical protein
MLELRNESRELQRGAETIEKWNLRRVDLESRNLFWKKFRAIDLRKLFQFS